MNKRFKRSGFDKRIIGNGKDVIDSGNQIFQIYIGAVGKNADGVFQRRNHKNDRPESSIKTRMVNNFRRFFGLVVE